MQSIWPVDRSSAKLQVDDDEPRAVVARVTRAKAGFVIAHLHSSFPLALLVCFPLPPQCLLFMQRLLRGADGLPLQLLLAS